MSKKKTPKGKKKKGSQINGFFGNKPAFGNGIPKNIKPPVYPRRS